MEDWECYYSFSRAHRKESYSGVATFVRRQVGTSLIRVVAAEEGLSGLLNPDQPSHPNDGSSRSSYGGGGYISHYGDLFKEFDRKELARLDDEGRVL